MADHTHPAGTKLSYDLDGIGAYTDLAEIVSIKPPNSTRNRSPNTNLEDTAKILKSTPGYADPGEGTFKVYMTKTQYNTFIDFFNAGTELYWKVTYPETSTLTWQGYISAHDPDEIVTESDDKIQASFSMQANTLPDFTPAP